MTLMRYTKLAFVLSALLMLPTMAMAQTYASLWKQEKAATDKDQPRTQLDVLEKIAEKAGQEKAYGHLLMATVKQVTVWGSISEDSVKPALRRLEDKEKSVKGDIALRAVYDAAISRLYRQWGNVLDDSEKQAALFAERAMERPDKLASQKATDYAPFVDERVNSNTIFNDDLLSVIGYETKEFDKLHAFYSSVGNRKAACITALEIMKQKDMPSERKDLKKSPFIQALDSLATEYQDLDVAGEVAVERYNLMDYCKGVTVEDRISYIHYALEKWGAWQRMGELRNAERSLTQPMFCVKMDKGQVTPNTRQTARLEKLRNINALTVNIYSTNLDGDTELDPNQTKDYKQMKSQLTLLPELTQTRTFTGQPDYLVFEDSIVIPALPVGVYMLEFVSSPTFETQRGLYRVSDVFTIAQSLPDRRRRYAVVNATTGQPIAGAKLRISISPFGSNKQAQTVTLTTDKQGEAIYSSNDSRGNVRAYAYTDNDRAACNGAVGGLFYYNDTKRHQQRTSTFTDRAIYRPGQTVHATAIVYSTDDNVTYTAVAGTQVKAILRDANFQQLDEKTLTTDSYGKCSADFTLPKGKLTGRYYLMINKGTASFNVEEYKRPTFSVEFPDVTEKYQNGDTLMVKGKAVSYAGVPVQGAKVKYTVKRTPAYWWFSTPWHHGNIQMEETVMKEGEAITDVEGSFLVEMPMVLPDMSLTARAFYNFVVVAHVSDAAGESHDGELSVPLGSRAATLTSSLQAKVLADSANQVTFNLRNASGYDVNADVIYRFDSQGEWLTAKTMQPCRLAKKFTSGRHSLMAICEGDTLSQDFVAFSLDDTKPCTTTDDWFYVSAPSFPRDGQPVTVQIGSSAKDMHVVYAVYAADKVLDSGAFSLSDALQNVKLTYKEEYGDGVLLTFAWVKNGKCFTHEATIKRPLPDKNLKMEWTTFRDRLTPGQSEEWTLTVKGPDGKPVDASVVATLYDKSLDQLRKHQWAFSPQAWLHTPNTMWRYFSVSGLRQTSVMNRTWQQYKTLDLSMFDDQAFAGFVYGLQSAKTFPKTRMLKAKETASMRAATFDMVEANGALQGKNAGIGLVAEMADDAKAEETLATTDQIRENLNETAFFFPNLKTDADGNVSMTFTMPESLTTWRFMGLANTVDMMFGLLSGETVTQKPVMVQPNVPRFVRTGDEAQIAARISNTTKATVSGTARMTLVDPETEKNVYSKDVAFTVEAGKTATVTFGFQPDGKYSLLVCKISAQGKGFSDGEQHYLPILPDHERVTTTVPFSQNSPGVKVVDMSKLIPSGADWNKLTVEYTNNPAWIVVQSLPYVASSNDDNAISQATALYANTIGQKVANLSPKLKQTFEQWKMEQGDGTSLMSPLSSNEDLKDIAVAETPWLNDADRETEQKMRMADFFDENTMRNRIATATDKLSKLQNADGSWSWWRGMEGNVSMTVEVASMLSRLHLCAGEQAATKKMLDKAMAFLDKEMVKKVNAMKSEESKGHKQSFPGIEALRYLYVSTISNASLSKSAEQAQHYLLNLLKKDAKNQTIYEKALAAVVFASNNETALTKEYGKSLKEYTVYDEEMGRYYDTRKATYSWYDYKIPTQVAAIEALSMTGTADKRTIEEMQQWLLQEKRTQAWSTPINTINAIYAFINNDMKALEAQEQVTLAIDGKKLDTPKATAGIGYVKTSIERPTGKAFTATKTSQGTSWGALYAQFTQKTTDIATSSSYISVKRELVSDKKEMTVGDRIRVRITIEAKRDLDFVQVTDRRAACMEPVGQLSGYRHGYYCAPKDNTTNYYFNLMPKGRKIVIETDYYIDRAGKYETGTCSAECAYAPEYRATAKSETLTIKQ